jgi:hypothetical protein
MATLYGVTSVDPGAYRSSWNWVIDLQDDQFYEFLYQPGCEDRDGAPDRRGHLHLAGRRWSGSQAEAKTWPRAVVGILAALRSY